jgi:hypothetical protein
MNSDFPIRALMDEQSARERLLEREQALAALNRVGTPASVEAMRDVLGYAPQNRRDRRKAEKLLCKKGHA